MSASVESTYTAWKVIQELFGFSQPNAAATLVGNYSDVAIRTLIYHFNCGILMAVIAIYAFILVVGTINTARDGTFLGKNWDSYWIPLRVILGSAAAIPLKSGFCIAQYLIFLCVSLSINFANNVWQGTYEGLMENRSPPVASVDIVDGIKSNLALFLLSRFSSHIAQNLLSLEKGKDIGTIDMQTKLDQISIVQAIDAIEKTKAPIYKEGKYEDSLLWRIKKTIVNRGDAGSQVFYSLEPNLNAINQIKQGNLHWSSLVKNEGKPDNSLYQQYSIAKLINSYDFRIPSSASNEQQQELIDAINAYCVPIDNRDGKQRSCSDLQREFQNIFNQPLDYEHWSVDPANLSFLALLPSYILNALQNKIKEDQKTGSKTSEEWKKEAGDWWNADQKYLIIDDNFSTILKNFYDKFNVFEQLSSQFQTNNLALNKKEITIEYYKNKYSIEKLLKNLQEGRINYTTVVDGESWSSDSLKTEKVDVSHVNKDTDSDKYISVDMSKFKQHIINALNIGNNMDLANSRCNALYHLLLAPQKSSSSSQKYSCEQLVSKLVPNSVSADFGKYFLVIDAALSNITAKPKYKLEYATALLYLFRIFQLGGVGLFQDGILVSDLASPAEKFLDGIFSKMGISASSVGVFSALYNIGMSVDGKPSPLSTLQQIQAVGKSIISLMINTLQGVAGKARDALRDVIIEVSVLQGATHGVALGLAAASFFTPALAGVVSSVGDFGAQLATMVTMSNLTMSLIWLPLVFFILVTLFTTAVIFALVIPLTPFLLFWAGKVAWLFLLIEAIIAAPIIALGVTHPEGHEVYGKSEPSVQILLNLILRPVLMVVGLIIGIILTYLLIRFSAIGFHGVATQIANFYGGAEAAGDNYVAGSLNIMMMFMYANFIALAFYKCFSLIYILPDKILHWVGGSHNERAGEQDLQEMKSSATQSAQGLGQSATQVSEKYTQAKTEQMHGTQQLGSSASKVLDNSAEYRREQKKNKPKSSRVEIK
ncbi:MULTISPECIES: DotA/TraY family protein [Cysteiniphilum]|uniref:DotA/TraY family protein n=1 Tax=Cysteiniphilum TaxID=2056696 RepID=UPI001781CBDD|nr:MULTISPECIES: DotA/TraY family protein [Cysteiniphilum]